jgi:2-hydroxychromene-2-carboxylate isomerase
MQTPLKGPYLLHDVPRFARLLGVPLTLPPVMPMNSLAASRACVWLDEHSPDLAKRLAHALFGRIGAGAETWVPRRRWPTSLSGSASSATTCSRP